MASNGLLGQLVQVVVQLHPMGLGQEPQRRANQKVSNEITEEERKKMM